MTLSVKVSEVSQQFCVCEWIEIMPVFGIHQIQVQAILLLIILCQALIGLYIHKFSFPTYKKLGSAFGPI